MNTDAWRWRYRVRTRSLCTNPSEVRIERGTLEEETQRATFSRQVLQGEGSLYDAVQRLFEKKFTILQDGLDNSSVLFLEH